MPNQHLGVPLTILRMMIPHLTSSSEVGNQPGVVDPAWHAIAKAHPTSETQNMVQRFQRQGSLTRNAVIGLGTTGSPVDYERVAVAALMWGYGNQLTRWKKQVGPVGNVVVKLRQLAPACAGYLQQGDVTRAYSLFTKGRGNQLRYPYFGVAYISKVLYFLSRALNLQRYPVIVDKNVVVAVANLYGARSILKLTSYHPAPDAEAYVRLADVFHDWAAQLGTTAEAVEHLLWQCGGSRVQFDAQRTAFWAECSRHW